MAGRQGGAAGRKPIRDPPAAALQEPPFPSETCQGNKSMLRGEEAENRESQREEWTAWFKSLAEAHRRLRAALRRTKSPGQSFPKRLDPACAYGKSLKGFAEILLLTCSVITKRKPNTLLSGRLIGEWWRKGHTSIIYIYADVMCMYNVCVCN